MAISRTTALLRKADPATIAAYSERIEAGESIEEILIEVAMEAAQGPGATKRIEDKLCDLLEQEKLTFDNGTFVATAELTKDEATHIAVTTINLANSTESIGNMGRWVLGNIAVVLEDQGFALSDLIEPTQMSYNTIATSAKTFREFRDTRFKLPFAHHKEIAYAKDIPTEGKHAILKLAEDEGLPVLTTRKIASALKDKVRAGVEITDWKAASEEAHTALNDDKPATATIYGLVGPDGFQVLHAKPSDQQIEEAFEVFKISRVLKTRPEQGAAGGVPEAVQPNATDGGAAPGDAE